VSYVSLMVHVDADRELGGRISIAADLADRFHARLIGIAGWAPMSVFLAEEALRQARSRGRMAIRSGFSDRSTRAGSASN
jgi:hypothetical protein